MRVPARHCNSPCQRWSNAALAAYGSFASSRSSSSSLLPWETIDHGKQGGCCKKTKSLIRDKEGLTAKVDTTAVEVISNELVSGVVIAEGAILGVKVDRHWAVD